MISKLIVQAKKLLSLFDHFQETDVMPEDAGIYCFKTKLPLSEHSLQATGQ